MKPQPPRGTRDFYPQEMSLRLWLESRWRSVSVRNGFEEVDGPVFETLDLYKIKSGEGIVSELFSFRRTGGKTDFALRPEFTPTLARMVAAKAQALPRPIKWFCLPNLCRAERPQRGRLREFLQWNVDLIGPDSPAADAEVIFTAVDLLRDLGLGPSDVRVRLSHRTLIRNLLMDMGVAESALTAAFELLDRREKMDTEKFAEQAAKLGLGPEALERFNRLGETARPAEGGLESLAGHLQLETETLEPLRGLHEALESFGILDWCTYDLSIVRGLAYYTGAVFEVHEARGAERAIAGGGRYDRLIEMFGGPPTPACGFGMGDVVLSLVLADRGLIPQDLQPTIDAYVLVADEAARPMMFQTVAALRSAGFHTRFSYRSTTKLGKLIKEADQAGARYAVILDGRTVEESLAGLKNLATSEQSEVPLDRLPDRIG
ncbi:MAG: histidine--tRNA ligase [Phycisphaeraceae bacterium]|nr:histidine--tRNA ligase [Phycisphaeraceae bacterium]